VSEDNNPSAVCGILMVVIGASASLESIDFSEDDGRSNTCGLKIVSSYP
jgi:hypothetical protein